MFRKKVITLVAALIFFASGFCIFAVAKSYAQNKTQQHVEIARPVHIFESPAQAAAARKAERAQKINRILHSHRVSKKLLLALCFVLIFPLIVSFLIIKKFNRLINNVQNTCQQDIKDTVNQLNEFQNNIRGSFKIEGIETDPDKLSREIDNFLKDLTAAEKQPETKIVRAPKNNYTQAERRRIPKPQNPNEPQLLSQRAISKNRGFYLIDYGNTKALVGYIRDEIFILNKFKHMPNYNIQVRLTEKVGNKYIFIVKAGHHKSLVQVEKERMKVLLDI